MKKWFILLSLIFVMMQDGVCQRNGNQLLNSNFLKPRMVVLTDVSTWETDDSESLIRLMVHADLFEIEGLVFTTGWSLDKTRDDFFDLIHDAVNA